MDTINILKHDAKLAEYLGLFVEKWFDTYLELSVPPALQMKDNTQTRAKLEKYGLELLNNFKGREVEDLFLAWDAGILKARSERFDWRFLNQFVAQNVNEIQEAKKEKAEQPKSQEDELGEYTPEHYRNTMRYVHSILNDKEADKDIQHKIIRLIDFGFSEYIEKTLTPQEAARFEDEGKEEFYKSIIRRCPKIGTLEELKKMNIEDIRNKFNRVNRYFKRDRVFPRLGGDKRLRLILFAYERDFKNKVLA